MLLANQSVKRIDTLDPEIKRKALRTLLWFGIVSITMLFAGLTSAYIVRQGEGKWAEFTLPRLFALSCLIIILSSVSMQWALTSIKKNNARNLRTGLMFTLLLGIGFVVCQYLAWSELYRNGIVFTGTIGQIKSDYHYVYTDAAKETAADISSAGNVAGSFLYVLTGLHVAHLLAGLIALLVVNVRSLRNKYSSADYNGVRMVATYWHFLGGLWLYLFLFLLYIR
jgi:cytochrome c oxidase subunit 3